MKLFITVAAIGLMVAMLASAQGGGDQRGQAPPARGQAPPARGQAAPARGPVEAHAIGNGHIPAHGPLPTAARTTTSVQPVEERRGPDQPGHPVAPHVHAATDEWTGHETGRDDPHYKLTQPWQHGRFSGTIGSQQIWRLTGGTDLRFSLDGNFFQVAAYDRVDSGDWRWSSDDIVLYLDPDHDGWYVAYNVRLGTYVHVMYMG